MRDDSLLLCKAVQFGKYIYIYIYMFTSYSEQHYALIFTVEFCEHFTVAAVRLDALPSAQNSDEYCSCTLNRV